MKNLILLWFTVLSMGASGQIPHDLQFPSISRSTGANKPITCSFGEIHGKSHFHSGIDIGVTNAKLRPAYESHFRENGKIDGRNQWEYVDFAYYGWMYDPGQEIYIMRYLHTKRNPNLDSGTNWAVFEGSFRQKVFPEDSAEYIIPLTKAEMLNLYPSHLHFCVIKNQYFVGEWLYGNPLYNSLMRGSPGSRADLYLHALWNPLPGVIPTVRNLNPIHDATVDIYPPNIPEVFWDPDKLTQKAGKTLNVMQSNFASKGPVVRVIDTGINCRLSGLDAENKGCTIYRIDSYVQRQGTTEWEPFFVTCFSEMLYDSERDKIDQVFAQRINYGNNDYIKMYRTSDALSVQPGFAGYPPLWGTYDQLDREGKYNIAFVALGYENAAKPEMHEVPGWVDPNPPGFADTDEFGTDPSAYPEDDLPTTPPDTQPQILASGSVVIDRDPNPRLVGIKAWQDLDYDGLLEDPEEIMYECLNGTVVKNVAMNSLLQCEIQLSFSEDADISSVDIASEGTSVRPSFVGHDPKFGVTYESDPPAHDPDESKWLIVFPARGHYTGTFTLNLVSTDLADNAVNISTPVQMQFVDENSAKEWQNYR